MKTITYLAVLASAVLGFSPKQAPNPAGKSFVIFFYENPQGFADRTNQNSATYWKNWTGYIGSVQSSGAMESGSALLPPTVSAEIDNRGSRKVSSRGVSLSGYIVVRANSLQDALGIAKKSPAISEGGKVEVREVLPMAQHNGGNK